MSDSAPLSKTDAAYGRLRMAIHYVSLPLLSTRQLLGVLNIDG